MNDSATYKAVLFGPNPIASGTEVDLDYVDGKYQEVVVIETIEDGVTITRTYHRGRDTAEPVPYRFVDEGSNSVEADVPN